jgi:hypothetical protein
MNKFYIYLILCLFASLGNAQQTKPAPTTLPYGKVDMADLEMTSCDFEKDANAEVLFDKASVMASNKDIVMQRHVRIKIFNDFGKNEANIRIGNLASENADIQAETINLVNGKIEITPLDKKLIYAKSGKNTGYTLSFAFPNVKAGSIIEYKYALYIGVLYVWPFQSNIPTRFSEIETLFAPGEDYKVIPHVNQPLVINTGFNDDNHQDKALANIRSLPDEPFMDGRFDNLQRVEYLIFNGIPQTWLTIGNYFSPFFEAGGENLAGEDTIISHAKRLKSDDEKIAFIFDEVKNNVKWDEQLSFYTAKGKDEVWDKKVGNSAEVNMIVYHFLKKLKIKAFPMIVGNKRYGKISPVNPSVFHFVNTVIYVPVDSSKFYILDATNKFNLFNTIPAELLNTYGLSLDEKNKDYPTVFLEEKSPAIESVVLNGEIKPDGKMSGSADITSFSYNKAAAVRKYKTDGEKKYTDSLLDGDNSIKISSLKLENMDVDSLPLSQKIDFTMDLSGSDDKYIYFKPYIFNLIGENPFVKEDRFSDIDFGYMANYSISNIYKLPAGFQTDALPKSTTIVMPDGNIAFKRIVAEENGILLVKYILVHKKSLYFKEDYRDIRGFYKKMYELLNEQIVLKKAG